MTKVAGTLTLDYPSNSLLVLVGPPGSGKTTLANRLLGDVNHYAPDLIWLERRKTDENFDFGQAFDEMFESVKADLAAGKSASAEVTGLNTNVLYEFADMLEELGLYGHLICFDVPEEVCREGLKSRESKPSEEILPAYYKAWKQIKEERDGFGEGYQSSLWFDRHGVDMLHGITFGPDKEH